MEISKHELQNIILGDEQTGSGSQLKTAQSFLRRYAETSGTTENQQHIKDQETTTLINFAGQQALYNGLAISEKDYIGEGAEQKVYRLDDSHVIKANTGVFYERWLDYFNSLLIHNLFFPATAYTFLGFQLTNGHWQAIVKQRFIRSNETTVLADVKDFLDYNGFQNKRNNDYFNPELGLIFEDLHDENVLCYDGVLYLSIPFFI